MSTQSPHIANAASGESDRPIPPRFYWLKRLTLAWLAMALLAAGTWWAWDRVADRRMAAFIAAAHARGEPIVFEDFAPRSVPPERNAAVMLNQVVGTFAMTRAEMVFENGFAAKLPLSAADQATLDASVTAHAKDLALVHAARARPELEWGHRFSHPMFATMLPWLSRDRQLEVLLQWSALFHATAANDSAAVSDLQDMQMFADTADQELPCFVTHIVALGMHDVAATTAIRIAPSLQVGELAGAKRADIEALIRQLLDDAPLQAGFRRACLGQRMGVLDYPPGFMGLFPPRWLNWRPSPVQKLRALHEAADMTAYMNLATAPDWPAAKKRLPSLVDTNDIPLVQSFARGDLGRYADRPDRAVLQQFRVIGQRHIAAIVLAVRLYAIDHEGRLPTSLNELVPHYLPTGVPIDPFRADGGPLSYRPDCDPPIVYSVGFNGTDEGGSNKRVLRGRSSMIDEWDDEDAVYPLVVPRPAPVKSPATGPS